MPKLNQVQFNLNYIPPATRMENVIGLSRDKCSALRCTRLSDERWRANWFQGGRIGPKR